LWVFFFFEGGGVGSTTVEIGFTIIMLNVVLQV
jgi:hypothetical protein